MLAAMINTVLSISKQPIFMAMMDYESSQKNEHSDKFLSKGYHCICLFVVYI